MRSHSDLRRELLRMVEHALPCMKDQNIDLRKMLEQQATETLDQATTALGAIYGEE